MRLSHPRCPLLPALISFFFFLSLNLTQLDLELEGKLSHQFTSSIKLQITLSIVLLFELSVSVTERQERCQTSLWHPAGFETDASSWVCGIGARTNGTECQYFVPDWPRWARPVSSSGKAVPVWKRGGWLVGQQRGWLTVDFTATAVVARW